MSFKSRFESRERDSQFGAIVVTSHVTAPYTLSFYYYYYLTQQVAVSSKSEVRQC